VLVEPVDLRDQLAFATVAGPTMSWVLGALGALGVLAAALLRRGRPVGEEQQ
jgi:MYXO-CTERM domain-containing protein